MPLRKWFASPRRVLILFFAITLIPAAALGYLTWRLIEQDRSVAKQRLQERLDQAADRIGTAAIDVCLLFTRASTRGEVWTMSPALLGGQANRSR